jgi:hypothetical protein
MYNLFRIVFLFSVVLQAIRVGNEPNQLENCSRLDSSINSLNLNWKFSSLIKRVEHERYAVRLVCFINQLDIYIYIYIHTPYTFLKFFFFIKNLRFRAYMMFQACCYFGFLYSFIKYVGLIFLMYSLIIGIIFIVFPFLSFKKN